MLLSHTCSSVSTARDSSTVGCSAAKTVCITRSFIRFSATARSRTGIPGGAAPRSRSDWMISSVCRTHFSITRDQSSRTSLLPALACAAATATARCALKVVKNALIPARHSVAGSSVDCPTSPNAAESASTFTRSSRVSSTASLDGK
jgi:hypothetical protein